MADSIRSRPHTRSRSRVLSTGSVAVDDDDSSHSRSASGHPPGAFESSIVETPSRFEAGLNTAPDTVRPAPRSTRQLDAGSLDENNGHPGVYRSGEAISDQQMEHLKMILEMDKGKQRVLELELQLEKLRQQRSSSSTDRPQDVNNHPATISTARTATWNPNLGERLEFNLYEPDSRVGKAISQFKEDVKNTMRPNSLTGTSNYTTWSIFMKSKLVDAQCWYMIEKRQTQNPLQRDDEWAPFWDARNRWLYTFISNSLGAGVRPCFSKYDENRIAYTLWNAIEKEYSVLKTQLRREAVLEFMSLGGTQVTNLHTFFDKFRSAITKLEMLDASPSDAWIFDTFYSVLPNNWRNYVQKKIEEIQDSKSTAVVLDVDLLMEEIRSRLDPPKDKKNLQNIDSAANTATTATTDTMTTTSTNLNNNTSNPARGGRTGRGRGSLQGGSRNHRGSGNPPTCPECERSHFGNCWLANPDSAPDNWRIYNAARIKEFKEKKENNSGGGTQLSITDGSETFQMANLAEVINVPACFVELHKDPSNGRLYISKDVIFQEDLHLADPSIPTTPHNPKVLPNAARKAAAAIPSATPGLPTAARKETAAIPDPSIDNLFIDEEIRPECPLFLVPTNNWWIDYDISARIPTLLVQNTLNSPEPTVESDDPPTSTRDITIVGESTVGESSVGDSLEDLPTDPEIAALPIPKNLTRAKASMEWKYYYKARVKEVNRLKYTRWKENI
ncbi:uncharacterized protein BDCG_16046 [Blastomyces dermatitidis ER-3]|uniref:DUF4219 domain-containing protein n=1 Tax=Ajellomyces dermatitidis (strain ER-3 / ATCC MYA-2586) TaxID=559297 RepID=A0ABX2VPQ3_AJEDR|nr:uncharacterized protein BDCG_16046 [Blastomyces dermatitidis ER-3]OAS99259.1 hypothetical protein BDCG_16046 [Blastomyces dermatitidis ER-3]